MLKTLIFVAVFTVLASGRVVKRQAHPCPDECENKPLDISLIVDSSSSIPRKNFTIGKWFLQNFVDMFEIGPDQVRVSMVTYGNRVYEELAFGFESYNDKESLKQAILNVKHMGGRATETGMAIRWFLAKQLHSRRPGVRTVLIVLTDGNSQKPKITKAAADEALQEGLEVFAIGVGHQVSQNELHNIASSADHVFIVNDYNALDDIQHRLAYETCGVKSHPVCGFSPADISFVIDSSRSIGNDNFTLELTFIKEFLEVFTINPSSIRVAAIMFGDRIYDEQVIHFDEYTGKKNTLDAILNLKYMSGGRTETGQGINYMIDNFAPQFRAHAAHIGIVITDGASQNRTSTSVAAIEARYRGITTVAVGIGKIGERGKLSQEELEIIAGDPSRVITVTDFAALNSIRDKLTDVTCEGVALGLQSRGQ